MNQKDQLRIARLATTLIVEHPKATNDINRLKWMKSAIELLNLKQSEQEASTDNEFIADLKKVVRGEMDSMPLRVILNKIDTDIYELDDLGLMEGNVAQIAHDAMTHWVKLGESNAV